MLAILYKIWCRTTSQPVIHYATLHGGLRKAPGLCRASARCAAERGTAGTDHLRGTFHGPAHREAWGVFDTTGYIGVFGAKRTP